MPVVPPPQAGGQLPFWVVYYTSGTIAGSRGGGTGTAKAGYRIIRAASGTDAENTAQANGWNPVSFTGPYTSNAAAIAAAAAAKKTNVQANGGLDVKLALPNFLGALGQPNLWLRVLKVVGGVVLVIVGLVQLTHATQVIGPAARLATLA